jgi:LCP family protein required for cell wall assembly
MKRVEIGSYSTQKGWAKPESKTKPKSKLKKVKTKARHRFKAVTFLAVLFLLGICGFLFFNFGNRVPGMNIPLIQPAQSLCTNVLDPKCWTENFKPQLKQTNGFTNMLVIGMDTRKNNSGLLNTDTIALISFNHETGETMLLSIPRDFYSQKYVTRINAVYAFTKERDDADPFKYLKDEVSNITGQEIHYFTTVEFDSFTQIIDEFGGIEVCPEDAFTAQYPNDYPKAGESQWLFYKFDKGCQTVSGDKALVYARFRYVSKGPSSLASDFSRARRQQEVIEALKDRALAQDMSITDRASTYWKLIQNFMDNIDTNIGFEDVLAGLGNLEKASKDPIKVVLDPNFGGINAYIVTDSSSGAYYIKAKDPTYSKIQEQLDKIWENGDLYKENAGILVINRGKTYLPTNHPVKLAEKDISFKSFFTYKNEFNKADFVGVKIVDFTDGKKPESLKVLQKEIPGAELVDYKDIGLTRSSEEEDFVVLIGLTITITPTTRGNE